MTTAQQMFVNLPVADLDKSIEFFTAVGFEFNPTFTDETGTCMVLGENLYAMLLTKEKFKSFTPLPVSDATKATEVLVCLMFESRAKVESIVAKALAAGATRCRPVEDHGFMLNDNFRDPDGHIWEIAHMDMAAFEQAQQGA